MKKKKKKTQRAEHKLHLICHKCWNVYDILKNTWTYKTKKSERMKARKKAK